MNRHLPPFVVSSSRTPFADSFHPRSRKQMFHLRFYLFLFFLWDLTFVPAASSPEKYVCVHVAHQDEMVPDVDHQRLYYRTVEK